jgi:hypothetical protein
VIVDSLPYARGRSGSDRIIAIWLGLLFLSFYILSAQGSIQSLDGTIMYELTQSLVEKQSAAIDNPAGIRGVDGRLYSKYGLGQSLAAIPLYLAGRFAAEFLPLPFASDYVTKFFVSMLSPIATALTCVLLYLFGLKLGYSRKVALWASFVFGVATMAWPYSQTFYAEPLTTLLLLGTFFVLMKDGFSNRELLLAGAFLGAAVLTRVASLVALLPAAFYIASISKTFHQSAKRVLVFASPLLIALFVITSYNSYRFGSPWQAGYGSEGFSTPLLVGLFGFLISPGRGFFWYNPVLLLSLLGIPLLHRNHKEKSLAFLLLILAHLLFYSKWGAWEGGWAWGPRFLLVVVPYLALYLGAWLASVISVRLTTLLVALLLVSAAVQFSAVSVSPERYYYQEYTQDASHHMEKIKYDPGHSPLLAQWRSFAVAVKNMLDGRVLFDMARQQSAKGVTENERGKAYFLNHNLAYNSPNLWLFYIWYAGVPASIVLLILTFLLSVLVLSSWKISVLLRS